MTDRENNNSISANPFAALFSSLADARQFAAGQKQQPRPLAGRERDRDWDRGRGGARAGPSGELRALDGATAAAGVDGAVLALGGGSGALGGGVGGAARWAAPVLGPAGEETSASQDDSDNSVSESLDDCDYSVAEISRSFRSQRELCEQLNINHMIQRIFLITLDNSECSWRVARLYAAGVGLLLSWFAW